MKKITLFIALLFSVLAFAQPPNDTCANAITITGDGVISGTTAGAATESVPFCGSASSTSPGVYYVFTDMSGTGSMMSVSTCTGTSWDSKISVFTGSCGSFTCVDGNDDSCGLQSQVDFMTDGSSTYYVLVHGFGGANGPFELTVSGFPVPAGPSPVLSCAGDLPQNFDPPSQIVSVNSVADAGIVGTDYSIDEVNMNIQSNWAGDIELTLIAPSGTSLVLSSFNGGSSGLDTAADLVFRDDSGNDISLWSSGAPAADYQPQGGLLNTVFAGESITGDWVLDVFDVCCSDGGTLSSYCINFTPILGDPPIINCPMDITASNDPGQCGAVVNFGVPAAIDPDGDLDEVVQTQGPPSGTEFPIGTTLVEFTAYDLAGNSTSCTFNVIVTDDEDPAVTCNDIIAELDANGMITVLPGDVATAMDNCPGTVLEFLSSGGPSGSLQTLFARNNGGNFGGAVYFDVTVGPNPISINAFDTNTNETGAFTIDVYTTPGTSVGNETNPGAWTLAAVGSGTALGLDQPSNAVLDVPINLSAGTSYGIAIVMDASHGHDYTNGDGTNENYSNADLSIALGGASNVPFSGTIFSPRIWNGTIYYGSAGTPVPSLDFTCADVGDNPVTIQATDASGNTSTCTAIVTVEDNIAPVIQCWGQPGGADYLEEFEGASIPTGWTTDVEVGAWDWEFGSGDVPIGPDFPTNAAIFDDDAAGSGNVNVASLLSPVFDLSMATTASLSYDVGFQEFIDSELSVEVWDGAAWQQIALYDQDLATIVSESFDVAAFANADFQVRFHYDDLGNWEWHAGVDNFHLVYDVPSTPLEVELDENGMATVNASDLLLTIDEACGYTVTTGGGAPVPGSLQTLFASDNGGANGGAVYFDVTVGAEDISVTDMDLNIEETGAFTVDVYTVDGTYVGNEGNSGAWTLQTAASGTSNGTDLPSNAVLDTELLLEAGMSYGIAIVATSDHSHRYTNGDGSNENYSNADLSLTAGAASNVPFDGAPFSPRVVNTTINYLIGSPSSETIDFTCEDLGSNTIDITVTDASGNVSTCTSTVIVLDVTNPILVCMDAVVELDENGMAEVLPEYFIDTANSFDACGITITAVDVTDVTCDDIGTPITVTVFASDASGNLASCTAELTVVDAMGPVIEGCPDDLTVDPGPLNLFYELPDYWASGEVTATDNCTDPVTIVGQDPVAGTLLPDGTYTITIFAEDEYGNIGECTFELTVESVLGIADNKLENGVVLYPNPAVNTVTIANATTIQLEQAAIYDINGRLIQDIDLSGMTTEQSVDVSNLASGVYMVQIVGEEAQTVKRLVKE